VFYSHHEITAFCVQSSELEVSSGSRSMNKMFAIREQLFLSSIPDPCHETLVPGTGDALVVPGSLGKCLG
jgi:hypothetical protein